MANNVDDSRPILVQFENGMLKDECKMTTQFKYLRSKVPKSSKRMLIANTGSLTYTGNIMNKQKSLVKYYIGVMDKKTNKIEDIEACQICILKPKLADESAMEDKKDIKTFRQKSDTLVEAFGSAKQKRLLSARKKNESVNETISDKVADVAKKILVETPRTPKTAVSPTDDMLIIPPMNKEARNIQEIYHIDDIISFQDYQLLKGQAQEIIKCDNETLQTWKNEERYPQFILHHISQLPIRSSEREERACYLCYLNYLITVFKLTYKDVHKKDPCPGIPNPLKTRILDNFTHSENGRNRCVPKKYKDKLLCYILVLSLVVEEYEMNCNLLMKDLKLGVARISKLLRAIGCSVRTVNTKKRKADDVTSVPTDPSVTAALTMMNVTIKAETKGNTPVKKEAKIKKETNIKKEAFVTPHVKHEPEH